MHSIRATNRSQRNEELIEQKHTLLVRGFMVTMAMALLCVSQVRALDGCAAAMQLTDGTILVSAKDADFLTRSH